VEETRINQDEVLKRGLTSDIVSGVVSGMAGGVGAAVVQQGIAKLGGGEKPADEPEEKK